MELLKREKELLDAKNILQNIFDSSADEIASVGPDGLILSTTRNVSTILGIQGYASLMLYDTDPAHPYYEKLKIIEQQINSGANLARQLLGYARGRNKRFHLSPGAIRLIRLPAPSTVLPREAHPERIHLHAGHCS